MRMTRLFASLLCFLLLLSVFSCRDGDPGSQETKRTETESASEAVITTDDGKQTEPDVSSTAESREDSLDSEPLTVADLASSAAEPGTSDTREPMTQMQDATDTAEAEATSSAVSEAVTEARTESPEPSQSDTEESHTGIVLPDIDI